MRLLVFGASGLLGSTLCQWLSNKGHDVQRFSRDSSNPCLDQEGIVRSFDRAFRENAPDCVINLVGATNVDTCERDKGYAALLNCFIPLVLSRLCKEQNIHLVHISSDQVYGGASPHREDHVKPLNTYALTKLVGEYPVLQSGGCVLRTNFFGRSRTPGRSSLSDWLVQGGREKIPLNVFVDVWFSPLGLNSLSRAITHAVEIKLVGLYNLGTVNCLSKADFAQALFVRLGLDTRLLNPTSVSKADLFAQRPNDMRMDSSRFVSAAAFDLPTIEEEIENEAKEYL